MLFFFLAVGERIVNSARVSEGLTATSPLVMSSARTSRYLRRLTATTGKFESRSAGWLPRRVLTQPRVHWLHRLSEQPLIVDDALGFMPRVTEPASE